MRELLPQGPWAHPSPVPLRHIGLRDGSGGHLPGAVDAPAGQAFEVELAADLGVRAAGVGHVVAVEGHHVAEDVRGGVRV